MASAPIRNEFSERSDFHAPLIQGLAVTFNALSDVIPLLRAEGFGDCADMVKEKLAEFQKETPLPLDFKEMKPKKLLKAIDASVSALAKIHGKIYFHVKKSCEKGEHPELVAALELLSDDYKHLCQSKLHVLGLEYYEFKSLALHVSTLKPIEEEVEAVRGIKKDRHRRQPKNAEAIEAKLRECLATAVAFDALIEKDKRKGKLAEITGGVQHVLDTLPAGDTEQGNGERIDALVKAVASILKVEKWVRKVDLLDTLDGKSKQKILQQFSDLDALAKGQSLKR